MRSGPTVRFDPPSHYDRVTAAWRFLLGEDLHYGVFETGDEDLAVATAELTRRMAASAELAPDLAVLDVGCGTGAPACWIAERHRSRVTGISTSKVGIEDARCRAGRAGLAGRVSFEVRDGMGNGFADASFDRVWVLESSHLMPRKDRLLAECARVLRPGGRLVLCDIVLRSPMPLTEVLKRRDQFLLLRDVFGQAKMESIDIYRDLARSVGLVVDHADDLSQATQPTFARWRENAHRHRSEVVGLVGEASWRAFAESCGVLEELWRGRVLGYGLFAARRAA